jgi:repressor LexA
MPPPNNDVKYLAILRDYYASHFHLPSNQRIGELLGFSKVAARKMLYRLARNGLVTRSDDDNAWIPTDRFFERPLIATTVQAGLPQSIDAIEAEPFWLDHYVVSKPSQTVMVPVRGDSMSDAGIHEGDIAIIERQRSVNTGDLVIAIVDNEFTLKELGYEDNHYILIPHNRAYPVIRPRGKLEIYGVMVGLVRRYAR